MGNSMGEVRLLTQPGVILLRYTETVTFNALCR
jgi:hypothetical protein